MATYIRRREFIVTLGGVVAAWPRSVLAQATDRRVLIAWLWAGSQSVADGYVRAGKILPPFLQGMRDLGYTEGRDFAMAYRFADGDYELARTLKLKDRELDALTNDLSEKFVQQASSGSELVPSYVDLIFVARALERIGDHATNIAEDAFWRDQGADIRHTYGPKKQS